MVSELEFIFHILYLKLVKLVYYYLHYNVINYALRCKFTSLKYKYSCFYTKNNNSLSYKFI